MQCNSCGLDGMITSQVLRFAGDDSPETQTKAYYDLTFTCRNPNCPSCGKEIGSMAVEVS